jgi:putative membrane protein
MTMMWWNDGMGYAMGWGGWVLMTVVMVVFWALVIVGIVALFRTATTTGQRPGREKTDDRTAREILDERFARGDIDADEYRTRTAQLRSGN